MITQCLNSKSLFRTQDLLNQHFEILLLPPPTKRGARTTPTPKGHIKESRYGRQRDGHISRDNQNFPISPKFMLFKIVAIFCDVLMSLVSECSNVYCCSNKYRNTFTADNINILPASIHSCVD